MRGFLIRAKSGAVGVKSRGKERITVESERIIGTPRDWVPLWQIAEQVSCRYLVLNALRLTFSLNEEFRPSSKFKCLLLRNTAVWNVSYISRDLAAPIGALNLIQYQSPRASFPLPPSLGFCFSGCSLRAHPSLLPLPTFFRITKNSLYY